MLLFKDICQIQMLCAGIQSELDPTAISFVGGISESVSVCQPQLMCLFLYLISCPRNDANSLTHGVFSKLSQNFARGNCVN